MNRLWNILRLIALAVVAAAIIRELRQPSEERAWHGHVLGFIPYDFRIPPSLHAIRSAYWNPDDPRIFTSRVLGIGWGINVPSLFHRVRELGEATIGK